MKINGTWKSHSGSILKLEENNGILSGIFHRGSEPEGVNHTITGSIDPDDRPAVQPLSFFLMTGADTPLWEGTGISYDNFDKVG